MANPPTSNRHEETIAVDFDISKARANLGILQQAVDALKASVGAGGGGIPVALPGVAGVGAGLGGGATTSSVALAGQQQVVDGMAVAAPSGGGGGGGRGGGGTRSSGSLWTSDELREYGRPNQDADDARRIDYQSRERAAAMARERAISGASGMLSIYGGAIASGSPAAMIGGGIGAMGTMMNLPRPMSAVISSLGAITTAGIGTLDDLGERRAGIERDFGITQLSGIGSNPRVGRGFANYIGDAFGMPGAFGVQTGNGLNDFLRRAYRVGSYSPEEATGMASQYAAAAGGMARGDRRGGFSDFLTMSLAGIDPGAVGAIDRTRLLGGALGSAASTMGLAGLGQGGFGIQGALNEWMRSLAGQIDRLIHRGLRVDTASFESMLGRMAASPELAKLGLRAADVAGGMAGMAGGARDTLLSPFAGFGQRAALIESLSRSTDIFGAARYAEGMGPGEIADATSRIFGAQIAGASFAKDLGVTMDQGGALADLAPRGRSFGLRTADPRTRAMYAHRAGISMRDVTDRAPSLEQDVTLSATREAGRNIQAIAGKLALDVAGSDVMKRVTDNMTYTVTHVEESLEGLGRLIQKLVDRFPGLSSGNETDSVDMFGDE